jgi:hypothetical protein
MYCLGGVGEFYTFLGFTAFNRRELWGREW